MEELGHNKRKGILSGFLNKSKLTYLLQNKGDFTFSFFSDFIISIGFQSAALKSAYAFEKPVIFFTEKKNFFNEANFFFDKNKNKSILKIVKTLTFNGKTLQNSLSNRKEYESFLLIIKTNTLLLLEELGLYKNLPTANKLINDIISETKI